MHQEKYEWFTQTTDTLLNQREKEAVPETQQLARTFRNHYLLGQYIVLTIIIGEALMLYHIEKEWMMGLLFLLSAIIQYLYSRKAAYKKYLDKLNSFSSPETQISYVLSEKKKIKIDQYLSIIVSCLVVIGLISIDQVFSLKTLDFHHRNGFIMNTFNVFSCCTIYEKNALAAFLLCTQKPQNKIRQLSKHTNFLYKN